MFPVVFFGSSKYAAQVLEALIKDGRYDVKLVVTQPDAPVGREQILTPTAVATYVERYSGNQIVKETSNLNDNLITWLPDYLRLIKPAKLKEGAIVETIKAANPTLGIMLDYGLLIPKEIIELFQMGIINLHPSLLPKHRGAIPAVSTILDGDSLTGVTIIKIDEKFDQGCIIAQEESEVLQDDTPPVLYDRLFNIGVNLLLRVLPDYLAGQINPKPQPNTAEPYEKTLNQGLWTYRLDKG